ncbi:hypothetical protein SULI_07575 [Saccharolobus solfataricus]|uniref:Thermopsin n=3 Tax=Saccharolobus solfataricus TaxID=2287 RepID=Q97ZT1_SACS2|nr:hypothetical protein [Saccharolobus solfataricus]AAK40817.1 Hypothetical protein SSO0497 [Saccharolobus solfataricus P2]AKA73790.1 hypothetical protein SULB_1522 [Saccharolobus solfataricus]AKA76487.1 hypothetical protein SULC_1520 [Saccharolobus solfataricus]AKA79180.1 hypothetical protein SULA_1521 [Saccharolobus solfataricus]AZF68266.1 hypothetical protein SULG_07575 [Saccharolobus solfataricus]
MKALLAFIVLLLSLSALITSSFSIVIISPNIVKILSYAQVGNNIYSSPLWSNGTATVIHNTTYELVVGSSYSYTVQEVNFSNYYNFNYSTKYSYLSGVQAGAIILGGNVDLKKPANQQPYVLIYSVTSGQLLVKTPNTKLRIVLNNLPISVSGFLSIQFSNVNGNLTVVYISLNGNISRLVYITPIPWSEVKYAGWFQNYGLSYIYYITLGKFAESQPMIAGETYLSPDIVSSPTWKLGVAKIINITPNYETVEGLVSGSYVIQFYNMSRLNYLILTVNFTYYNGSNVGIELLGSNLNLTKPDLSQKVYALLYSVNNGELQVKLPNSAFKIINNTLPVIRGGLLNIVFLNNNNNISLYEIINGSRTYYLNITTPIPWSNISYIGWRTDNGISRIFFVSPNFIIGLQSLLTFEFLGNNGTTVPNQEFYIYIGDNLSSLQLYYKGYTNSDGQFSLPLPIIFPSSTSYEYVRIVWINSSTNITLIIPLIKGGSNFYIPANIISVEEKSMDVNINYYTLFLFIVLAFLLGAYIFTKGKRF